MRFFAGLFIAPRARASESLPGVASMNQPYPAASRSISMRPRASPRSGPGRIGDLNDHLADRRETLRIDARLVPTSDGLGDDRGEHRLSERDRVGNVLGRITGDHEGLLLVDRLGQHRRGAGLEVSIPVVGCGDRVGAHRELRGGEAGHTAAECAAAQGGGTVLERDGASWRARAGGIGGRPWL